jgi:hypothetical protein
LKCTFKGQGNKEGLALFYLAQAQRKLIIRQKRIWLLKFKKNIIIIMLKCDILFYDTIWKITWGT